MPEPSALSLSDRVDGPRVDRGRAASLTRAAREIDPETGEAAQYPVEPAATGATQPDLGKPTPKAVSLLTKDQRKALGMLATKAYQLLTEHHVIDPTQLSAKEWRHELVKEQTQGKATRLSDCPQRYFRALQRELYNLIGEGGRAMAAATKDQPGRADWELAWKKLEEVSKHWGYAFPGYASSLAQSRCRCGLSACTAEQLWMIFYQVNTNGRKRSRAKNVETVKPVYEG